MTVYIISLGTSQLIRQPFQSPIKPLVLRSVKEVLNLNLKSKTWVLFYDVKQSQKKQEAEWLLREEHVGV